MPSQHLAGTAHMAAVDGDGWQGVGEVVVRRYIDWSTGAVESAVATN